MGRRKKKSTPAPPETNLKPQSVIPITAIPQTILTNTHS
jgi:hypothetical protein